MECLILIIQVLTKVFGNIKLQNNYNSDFIMLTYINPPCHSSMMMMMISDYSKKNAVLG